MSDRELIRAWAPLQLRLYQLACYELFYREFVYYDSRFKNTLERRAQPATTVGTNQHLTEGAGVPARQSGKAATSPTQARRSPRSSAQAATKSYFPDRAGHSTLAGRRYPMYPRNG